MSVLKTVFLMLCVAGLSVYLVARSFDRAAEDGLEDDEVFDVEGRHGPDGR